MMTVQDHKDFQVILDHIPYIHFFNDETYEKYKSKYKLNQKIVYIKWEKAYGEEKANTIVNVNSSNYQYILISTVISHTDGKSYLVNYDWKDLENIPVSDVKKLRTAIMEFGQFSDTLPMYYDSTNVEVWIADNGDFYLDENTFWCKADDYNKIWALINVRYFTNVKNIYAFKLSDCYHCTGDIYSLPVLEKFVGEII